jgi:metal-sulfur cluster biosynthetic enzyme
MITESTVRATLNTIIDPCSINAGCPAGLDELGLVRAVDIRHSATGADLHVVIGVTEFGCLMSAPFVSEAYKRLLGTPGVKSVTVEMDKAFEWGPEDMSREYQQRLQGQRARRRRIDVPVIVLPTAPDHCKKEPSSLPPSN